MKRIVALFKPTMVDDVVFALHGVDGFPGGTMSEVSDIGRGREGASILANLAPLHPLPRRVRLEVVCEDAQVEHFVSTMRRHAHTGLADDGEIVISPVERVVSIMTGDCMSAG